MTPAHNQITAHQHALYETALGLRAGGCSVLPVNLSKTPYTDLLPRYNPWPRDDRVDPQSGHATWQPYMITQASEQDIAYWIRRGAQVAVATGYNGLTIIDFDDETLYHEYTTTLGPVINLFPIQRTGGGGYQLAFRSPQPEPNQKLAFMSDDSKFDGRSIGIETRGLHGYAIVYPSIHPSGNHYQIVNGDFANIPMISQELADYLLQVARTFCRAPYTKQQLEMMAQASQPRTTQPYTGASVIHAFNAAYSLDEILSGAGYQHCHGYRWSPPGAGRDRDSVIARNGKCFHFDTNYPLADNRPHDAFDVWTFYEHHGNVQAAVRMAASLLCMERAA